MRVSGVLHQILDPRGYQERPLLKLAPRVSLKELQEGKILSTITLN